MSNIVILVGSMRKDGNTDLLAQAFAEGARKNNSVEILSVADYKVNPCIGCNSCFAREGNRCFQNDSMNVIYEKLKVADIVVVASPVYFYGISAELKAVRFFSSGRCRHGACKGSEGQRGYERKRSIERSL